MKMTLIKKWKFILGSNLHFPKPRKSYDMMLMKEIKQRPHYYQSVVMCFWLCVEVRPRGLASESDRWECKKSICRQKGMTRIEYHSAVTPLPPGNSIVYVLLTNRFHIAHTIIFSQLILLQNFCIHSFGFSEQPW